VAGESDRIERVEIVGGHQPGVRLLPDAHMGAAHLIDVGEPDRLEDPAHAITLSRRSAAPVEQLHQG
jgi:hypothetical protein